MLKGKTSFSFTITKTKKMWWFEILYFMHQFSKGKYSSNTLQEMAGYMTEICLRPLGKQIFDTDLQTVNSKAIHSSKMSLSLL